MNEISFTSPEHLFFMGVSILGLWVFLLISNWIINWAIAWVNDSKEIKENLVWKLTCKIAPFKQKDSMGDLTESAAIGNFLGMPLGILFGPLLIFKATYFVISVAIIVSMAHLIRFVVRLNKKLKAHIEDRSAHR